MTDTAINAASELGEQFAESFRAMRHRTDLRRSLGYLNVLLGDIDQFLELTASSATDEEKTQAFHRLMTLALGASGSWDRMYAVSDALGFSSDALGRYALRKSSPAPFMFPTVAKVVREVIVSEYARIEAVVVPLEEEERQKAAKEQAEWNAFRDRVETVLPGYSLNCQVRFSEHVEGSESEDSSLDLYFAYPCRGIYDLSCRFPRICGVCENEGKEQSHTHGRVVLSSEDGLMLLPQVVRTQADLLQVIEDIRAADETKPTFVLSDAAAWYDACKAFLQADPLVGTLPAGDADSAEPCDLTNQKLGWMS